MTFTLTELLLGGLLLALVTLVNLATTYIMVRSGQITPLEGATRAGRELDTLAANRELIARAEQAHEESRAVQRALAAAAAIFETAETHKALPDEVRQLASKLDKLIEDIQTPGPAPKPDGEVGAIDEVPNGGEPTFLPAVLPAEGQA